MMNPDPRTINPVADVPQARDTRHAHELLAELRSDARAHHSRYRNDSELTDEGRANSMSRANQRRRWDDTLAAVRAAVDHRRQSAADEVAEARRAATAMPDDPTTRLLAETTFARKRGFLDQAIQSRDGEVIRAAVADADPVAVGPLVAYLSDHVASRADAHEIVAAALEQGVRGRPGVAEAHASQSEAERAFALVAADLDATEAVVANPTTRAHTAIEQMLGQAYERADGPNVSM